MFNKACPIGCSSQINVRMYTNTSLKMNEWFIHPSMS